MAKIISVDVNSKINSAYVVYDTGTEKIYPADKLPKTVQTWLSKNQIKEDPDPIPEEPVKEQRARAEADPAAGRAEVPKADPEIEMLARPEADPPKEQKSAKIVPDPIPEPVKLPAEKAAVAPVRYRAASEVVAFGVCMAIAILAHGLVELVSLLAVMLDTGWTLAKPRARAGIRWVLETGFPTVAAGSRIAARLAALIVWYLWIAIV